MGDGGLTAAGERPQQGLGDRSGEMHPHGPLWFFRRFPFLQQGRWESVRAWE